MKKQYLLLALIIGFSTILKAQDVTTYRGAFAPSPEPQWTDGWTNWDPQNASYSATTVTVNADITANTTWTSNNVYLLSGVIHVKNNAVLTIEAGTVIRGDNTVANSSLIITRGSKIQALGTSCNPIVFTSNKAAGSRAKADWGGVIILGSARNNLGTNVQIEGLAADAINQHGGTNDDDNSGVMRYVRIEFGGYVFSANNEINGLTMGSVGRGTTLDYIQVSFVNDDAFEWFGGSVNAKHLVAYRNLDDDFDTDNGFSGIVQYGLSIKDPAISDDPAISTSEGFESDNDATSSANTPKTTARFYNITQIGAFRCATNSSSAYTAPTATGFRRGVRFRRNTELKIYNSILMNNWRGVVIDAITNTTAQLGFQNNLIAFDSITTYSSPYNSSVAKYGEDSLSTAFITKSAFNNQKVTTGFCDILVNPWTFTNPDFRPNSLSNANAFISSGAASGTDLAVVVEIDNSLFTANQETEFLVDPFEQGGGPTNGIITITIPKPSGWNITVPGITLTSSNQSGVQTTSNVSGGTLNSNQNWNFKDDGTNVIATSKPGITIAQSDFAQIGFKATRKGTTSNGTNQNLGVFITGGGDNSPSNNSTVTALSAN